ncbi:poly [ADP-ribose] polymerase tankyrase-1-like [Pollicipes pollicipes]|uniref:poly [ADP-ribose] polymerase tankyrase-1-like n=1 Tax=Pollicipes pollicipes TaxID=41117 RepID=UPI0018855A87|nr:poly [ADP-ribose] polymerase tankyrase-1-like [Pollicipes pollicipes]
MADLLNMDPMAEAWLLPTQMLIAINSNDQSRAAQALEEGLDCDHRFNCGSKFQPALSLCIERGRTEIVQLLISRGCSVSQPDSGGSSPLHSAAYSQRVGVTRLLLRHGASPNTRDAFTRTPLHVAAENGSLEIVRLLVQAALQLAAAGGHADLVRLLLVHGAAPGAADVLGHAERTIERLPLPPRIKGYLLFAE